MKTVEQMLKNEIPAFWQRIFPQNLEGGGGVEFSKDIFANLNYATSLSYSRDSRFLVLCFRSKNKENNQCHSLAQLIKFTL